MCVSPVIVKNQGTIFPRRAAAGESGHRRSGERQEVGGGDVHSRFGRQDHLAERRSPAHSAIAREIIAMRLTPGRPTDRRAPPSHGMPNRTPPEDLYGIIPRIAPAV
jgi:hypothetical protein